MTAATYTLHGIQVFEVPADGPVLQTEREAADILGEAIGRDAKLVVLPSVRLSPDFFQLRTGLAGAIAQKFVNYRIKLAIVGVIPEDALQSTALQAFIKECNRGQNIWFLEQIESLEKKLAPVPRRSSGNVHQEWLPFMRSLSAHEWESTEPCRQKRRSRTQKKRCGHYSLLPSPYSLPFFTSLSQTTRSHRCRLSFPPPEYGLPFAPGTLSR